MSRAWRALRAFWAEQVEIQERMALLNRPWQEEYLHWSEGALHGSVAPPPDGRRRGVTRRGWCPGDQLAARSVGPVA